mmetsp:Transcript_7057/g.7793  ORF Transcript_7057/g.7793 Transcript_7057/m.7793 type:complete len:416 (-) Transcript_7057:63-1310(-)
MIRRSLSTGISSKLMLQYKIYIPFSICLLMMLIFDTYVLYTTDDNIISHNTLTKHAMVHVNTTEDHSTLYDNRKTHAIVHVGLRKTGTSSIQETKVKYKLQLEEDGYEMPKSIEHPVYEKNEFTFSDCFREEQICTKRGQERVASGLEIARRKKNILISSENFSYANSYEKLSEYLSNWDHTTIIIYYRRYYDWMCSHYHELLRFRKLKDTKLWEMTLLDYLKRQDARRIYIDRVMSRLRQVFDDIIIMDFHDKSQNLIEGFYCDAVPGAHHTCQAVVDASAIGVSTRERVSLNLVWGDLAFAAKSAGLIDISSDIQMDFAKNAIQDHQEQILGLTKDDFKLNCLSNEILQQILNESLKYELTFFPERNETDLRFDFEKAAKSKMCEVDLNAVLEDTEWRAFFKVLAGKLSSIED